MRKWRVVCPSVLRQRDRQADSEKTVSVCESHCEGPAIPPPHSAVSRLNTRRHTRWQTSQCTQESAVKYRGEALTHTHTHACTLTQVAGYAEVKTRPYSRAGEGGAGDVHTREWKRCVTCLWKSVRTAGVGKHTLDHSTFQLNSPLFLCQTHKDTHTGIYTHTQTSIVLTPMHFVLQYWV